MTEQQTKQLALLEETVNHYNSKNRAANTSCVYSPIPDVSEGCAIGRKIKDKQLCADLDAHKHGGYGVSNQSVFNVLPDELKELGMNFLHDLQRLHDEPAYWDEKGLSLSGAECVRRIKDYFNLV